MVARRKSKPEGDPSLEAGASPTLPSAPDPEPKPRRARAAAKDKTARRPPSTTARTRRSKKTEVAAAPAPKKSSRRTPQRRKAAAPTEEAAPAIAPSQLSPEERYRMIQDAAYYIAERHGFEGEPISFWLEAERQVNENNP